MSYTEIMNIIELINSELNKNTNNLSIEVICYIETSNHLYNGYYHSIKNGIIALTNSHLLDSKDNPIELTETYIQLDKDNIVSFSYKIISHNIF